MWYNLVVKKAKTQTKTLPIKTKYGIFQCSFEIEPDMGGYMVQANDVQEAISWGKNLSEAKKMIAEAIEGAIEANAIAEAEKLGIVHIYKTRPFALT